MFSVSLELELIHTCTIKDVTCYGLCIVSTGLDLDEELMVFLYYFMCVAFQISVIVWFGLVWLGNKSTYHSLYQLFGCAQLVAPSLL